VYIESQLSQHAKVDDILFLYSVPMRHFHPSLPPQVGSAVSVAFEAGTFDGKAFYANSCTSNIYCRSLARVRVAFSSRFSEGNFLTLSTPDSLLLRLQNMSVVIRLLQSHHGGWMDNTFLDSFAAEAEEEEAQWIQIHDEAVQMARA